MYEYKKAVFHNDFDTAVEILGSYNFFQVKKHAQNVAISCDWYYNEYKEMKEVCMIKFNSIPEVKKALLETYN